MKKYIYIVFLLATVFSSAQVNLYSEVDTKETNLNNPVVFTIVLEVSGNDMEQETPLKLPDFSKFDYDYASEQNTYIDPVKKIRINQQTFQFYLNPKRIGNIKIGSALVKVNGKIYKTEPIDIVVKEADKKPVIANFAKNMYLNMHIDNKEVYKDEPIVAVLTAYSKNISGFHQMEPEKTKMQFNRNFAIRNIANFDEAIEEDSEADFSSQVIAMFVIVPKITGNMDVPAAEVPIVNSTKLVSNKVKINVKKLPEGAPENYKNAVGKYNVKVELIDKNKENFEINKAFNVAVKIAGNGNLSPSLLPKILPSSDFKTFGPKIINNSKATTEGIEGEIEAHYVVIPKVRGDIKIATEDFSYFDPKEEKYIDVGKKILTLTAVNQNIADSKSTFQKADDYTGKVLDKVNSPVSSTKKSKIEKHKWIGFVTYPALIIAVFLLFVFLRKNKKKETKNENSQKSISNIPKTEAVPQSIFTFDLQSHFDYLEKMQNQSSAEFFAALELLFQEANQYCNSHFSMNFSDYLKSKGLADYEKYKQFFAKTEVEKYSPFNTPETLNEIFSEAKTVFSALED